MPKLEIKSSHFYEGELIETLLSELSQSISTLYGCSDEHVWVSWCEDLKKRWFFRGQSYSQGSLEFIAFEFFCFKEESSSRIENILLDINERILNTFPNTEIFGSYNEFKRGETILNSKLLLNGA